MTQAFDTDVLIAGGGPVGMTLALELARYGVRSILVERNPTTTRHPKMDLTNGRSMELFHRLGLCESLRDAGVPRDNPFDISWVSSLAGHELHRFKYPSANEAREQAAVENDGSQTREPGLRVSQIVIEPVLKKAIDESGLIDVRFGTAFEAIEDTDDGGITALVRPADASEPTRIRARHLAGCDGGGSTVRQELGIELDGNFAVASAYMVHFRSTDTALLQRWGVAWHYQNGMGTLIAQNDVDTWTLQRWLLPGMDPSQMTPEEVLEGWVGRSFDYEILQANPWSAHFVVAQSYGGGRVHLAGDAAHQFVPTGGYGMNSGIADAIGLAWMLAASVQGWAGARLLDAHDQERRPTAWWHLRAAERHMGVRAALTGVYLDAGDLEGDEPGASIARAQVAEKVREFGNAENESWGVEQGYRYDESPIVWHEDDPPAVDPLTYRPSTVPGARLPHIFLSDGVSIHDKLGLYFSLVVFGGQDVSAVQAAAKARRIPLTVVRIEDTALRRIFERDILLVRPDQHIAWRGDHLPGDVDELLAKAIGGEA